MAVRKMCKWNSGCKNPKSCSHDWWLDVMYEGKRFKMPVPEFAGPRLAPGETLGKIPKQEAQMRWEPLFKAEIAQGRNPRKPPVVVPEVATEAASSITVGAFLEMYMSRYVEAEGLRSIASVRSRIKTLKEHLGDLALDELEKPDAIQEFKATYRQDHDIASVNRALGVLRAAIN